MYARSTTIQAQPSSIDAGIAHVRDVVMPALQEVDGCVGVSLLVDRGSGRCIATSLGERSSDARQRPGYDRYAIRPHRRSAAARRSTSGRSRCCTATTTPVRARACGPPG